MLKEAVLSIRKDLDRAVCYTLCTGAELLSIEPWNTGADGSAVCEDMPRKSVDIRLTDYPV